MPTSLLTVIFIVWIIVPGTLFKRFYFQGFFAKQFRAGDFADRIITSVFWGILIQSITFSIFYAFDGISYEGIKAPLETIYVAFAGNQIPDFTEVNFSFLIGYILVALTIAVFSGTLAHKVVRFLKIDTKFRVFRFANHWHYYLMGDITSLKNHTTSQKKGKWLSTQADIVIKEGKETPKMFSGHISDYFISTKSGELESVILRNAERWCTKNKKFKPVPGDALMIPYSNVMDMNLTYATKTVDFLKRSKRKELFVNWVVGVGAATSFIFPLFTEVSFFRKLLGIGLLLTAVLLFSVFIDLILGIDRKTKSLEPQASDNNKKKSYPQPSFSWSTYFLSISLAGIFTLAAALVLDVDWIWSWIPSLFTSQSN